MTDINPLIKSTTAGQIAKELDKKDGKEDGKIMASIWNEFIADKGGKEIKYSITLENAMKSITTYVLKNANKAGETVKDLAESWLNKEVEYNNKNNSNTSNTVSENKNETQTPTSTQQQTQTNTTTETQTPVQSQENKDAKPTQTVEQVNTNPVAKVENSNEVARPKNDPNGPPVKSPFMPDAYITPPEPFNLAEKPEIKPSMLQDSPEIQIKIPAAEIEYRTPPLLQDFLIPYKNEFPNIIFANKKTTLPNGKTLQYDKNGYIIKEFDEKGNATILIERNNDGTIKEYHRYEYDNNNNETRSINYNATGTVDSYCDSEYDTNNNGTIFAYYSPKGELNFIESYKYDSNGIETDYIQYNGDKTPRYSINFEFDSTGNQKRSIYRNHEGKIDYFFEYDNEGTMRVYDYDYDSETGKLSTVKEFDGNDNLVKRAEYEYYAEDECEPDNKNQTTISIYNSDGLKIEEEAFGFKFADVSSQKEYYEYHENGQLKQVDILCQYKDPDEEPHEYSYHYDENGNHIKSIHFGDDRIQELFYNKNHDITKEITYNLDGSVSEIYEKYPDEQGKPRVERNADGSIKDISYIGEGHDNLEYYIVDYDSNGNLTQYVFWYKRPDHLSITRDGYGNIMSGHRTCPDETIDGKKYEKYVDFDLLDNGKYTLQTTLRNKETNEEEVKQETEVDRNELEKYLN